MNYCNYSKRIKIKFATTFVSDINSTIAQGRSYKRLNVSISSGNFSKNENTFFLKFIQMNHRRVLHSKTSFSRIASLYSPIYCYTTSCYNLLNMFRVKRPRLVIKSMPLKFRVPSYQFSPKITNIHRTNYCNHSKRIKLKCSTTFVSDYNSTIAQRRSYKRLNVSISSGNFSKKGK